MTAADETIPQHFTSQALCIIGKLLLYISLTEMSSIPTVCLHSSHPTRTTFGSGIVTARNSSRRARPIWELLRYLYGVHIRAQSTQLFPSLRSRRSPLLGRKAVRRSMRRSSAWYCQRYGSRPIWKKLGLFSSYLSTGCDVASDDASSQYAEVSPVSLATFPHDS